MMLDYLYVNNYRSLVNFRIDFSNVSVIMGSNGSGKTSVITVLAVLKHFIAHAGKIPDLINPGFLTKWMDSNIQTFEFVISTATERFNYSLEVEYDPEWRQGFARSESVKCNDTTLMDVKKGNVIVYDDHFQQKFSFQSEPVMSGLGFVMDSPDTKLLSKFKALVSEMVVVLPDPTRMKEIAIGEATVPDVQFTNIASVYAYLAQTKPEIITRIWEQMREIRPSFVRSSIDIGPLGKMLMTDHQYNDRKVSYNLMQLSEGERELLALYILLYGYIEQGIPVFIDEPDNWLSLREIQPWCAAVRAACEENGQCVMISHHPEVIDYYAGEAGIWMSRLRSGESCIKDELIKNAVHTGFMKYSELIAGGYLDEVS